MSNTFLRVFPPLWLFRASWFVRWSHVLFRAVSSSFMPRQFYFPLTFHPRIRGAFVGCRSCLSLPQYHCLKLTLCSTLPVVPIQTRGKLKKKIIIIRGNFMTGSVSKKSVLSESFAFQLLCFPQTVQIKTRSPSFRTHRCHHLFVHR